MLCAYHPAFPGLNPMNTIYTFTIYNLILFTITVIVLRKRTKINQKAGFARYLKILQTPYDHSYITLQVLYLLGICKIAVGIRYRRNLRSENIYT